MELPYVPGVAAIQVTKSLLDSKTISTGPEASDGMTTAVEGLVGGSFVEFSLIRYVNIGNGFPDGTVIVMSAGPAMMRFF